MSNFYKRALLAAYLIFITFLFCLPGSALPKNSWLDKIWFDKWVHIGLFAILCFMACWVWSGAKNRVFVIRLLIAAAVYGLCIEFIQDQFIPNRSFDAGDWIADGVGAVLGIFIWRYKGRVQAKK